MVLNKLDPEKLLVFLTTHNPFSVSEMCLRHMHAHQILSSCFTVSNPGVLTDEVKDYIRWLILVE